MRRNARQTTAVQMARVQGYHEGRQWENPEEYAYMGYNGNYYYTSDRRIPLTEDYAREDGKPMKGYGLEIECESYGITEVKAFAEVLEKLVFPHFPQGLYKMQRDGSLQGGYGGIECITQPMSKEAIRNNYAAFKTMYNSYFKAFRISASESGNCGMHVNISTGALGTTAEAQEEATRKLFYLVNKHYDFFCAAFSRNRSRTHYCSRMYDDAWTMDIHGFGTDHGVCFNLGHYDAGRIEIRLVGGQKDFGCFRNTMETIFHLVERVKKLSRKQCDDLAAVFMGCNQYVYDRLSTTCADYLTSEQLEKIAASVKREELL